MTTIFASAVAEADFTFSGADLTPTGTGASRMVLSLELESIRLLCPLPLGPTDLQMLRTPRNLNCCTPVLRI